MQNDNRNIKIVYLYEPLTLCPERVMNGSPKIEKGEPFMGCIRVTPRPSYCYRQSFIESKEEPILDNKITVCFKVSGLTAWNGMKRQATIRELVRSVLHDRGQYNPQYNNPEDKGYYTWNHIMLHQTTLAIGPIDITQLAKYEPLMNALSAANWRPDGEILITYFSNDADLPLMYNLSTILGSRQILIERALGLKESLKIIINDGLTLSLPLSVFSYPAIEAVVYLLSKASKMAKETGRARMKPCDMSNPKFQLRSWLLRLGFIGEEYERPRRTLLQGLEGDTAYFREEQRQKAVAKRKAIKLNSITV